MKRLVVLLVFLAFNLQAGIHQEGVRDYSVDQLQTHVLEIAKGLPNKGILKRKSNGYVYLDITNEYITKIFPNLILDGHLRPTDSFGSEEGAHISVISEMEKCAGIEEELGKEFTFQVKEFRTIRVRKQVGSISTWTGDRWMIAVESEELEELRMRYGLTPLVNQHDFHISIGFEIPFGRIYNFGEVPRK